MQPSADLLAQGYLWAFFSVFVGGFLTSLTPCVYPLIPITVSLFGARGDDVPRSRAMWLATCYVAGIGVMYSSLGIFSALAGRAFGTFMANPFVMVPIALLFLVMAASMFGAFELNLPPSVATRLSQVGGKGVGGAFAMGLVGGIIAAPCTGPVLASVLAFVATTRSVAVGASLLFTYALGMGVLFFAIAAFAVSLPKSGAWMEAVKSIFGIVMVVAALYFLRNVSVALRSYGHATRAFLGAHVLIALIGLAAGGIHLSFHAPLGTKVRKSVGVAAIIFGLFGGIGWLMAPKSAEAGGHKHTWHQGEAAGMAAAQTEHRPMVIDFSATWCNPCKEIELQVFENPEVSAELDRFVLTNVDCSDEDDQTVIATKAKYGANTFPTVVVLDSSGKVMHAIHEVIPAAKFLSLIRNVR
jgi:thiol:disulfide interchange protein DsbD